MGSGLNASRSFSSKAPLVQHFINGKFENSKATKMIELTNPATNEVIGLVPESTQDEMKQAVSCAKEAFKSWREVSTPNRVRSILSLLRVSSVSCC